MQKGFLFTQGNINIFYVSDMQNITDKIARKFINKICDIKGVGDILRKKALYDKPTLKDFKYRISNASLEYVNTGQVEYYKIFGKDFTQCFPKEEFNKEVIVI